MTTSTKSLRDTQFADLVFHLANERSLNLSDPGTGKTPPACLWTFHHVQQGRRVVWSQPGSLLQKNVDELLEWTPLTKDDVVIVDGTADQRRRKWQSNAQVYVCGPTCFGNEWHLSPPNTTALAIDEVHMQFPTNDSKRTQSLYTAMNTRFGPMLGMTGSLIKGRLNSAYPMVHILEPRYYMNHESFNWLHQVLGADGRCVGWKGHDRIGQILGKHAVRHTFEECYPDAKEDVIIRESCPMSPKQRAAYDEFSAKAILELEDRYLEGLLPGVHALRCRQIMACPEIFGLCQGEMTGKDERLLVHLADAKLDGGPRAIFGVFQEELERVARLCEREGFRTALHYGKTSARERAAIDIDFRNGRYDIVVGSAPTMAVGYNWEHIAQEIFLSLNYEDVDFVQARRRGNRGTRKNALRVSVLEYERSIDQRIFQIVERKSRDANLVDPTQAKTVFYTQEEAEINQAALEATRAGGFSMNDFI